MLLINLTGSKRTLFFYDQVSQPLVEEASHDGCDHENDDVDKLDRNVILAAEKKAIIEASIAAQKKVVNVIM